MAVVFESIYIRRIYIADNIDSVFIDKDNVLLGDIIIIFKKLRTAFSNTDANYMSGSTHSGLPNKQFFK